MEGGRTPGIKQIQEVFTMNMIKMMLNAIYEAMMQPIVLADEAGERGRAASAEVYSLYNSFALMNPEMMIWPIWGRSFYI